MLVKILETKKKQTGDKIKLDYSGPPRFSEVSVEKRVEVGRGLEILCSAQEIGLTIYFERFLAYMYIREAAKKDPPLMARPLRPYPPPLELNGHRNFSFNFLFFSLKIAENGF